MSRSWSLLVRGLVALLGLAVAAAGAALLLVVRAATPPYPTSAGLVALAVGLALAFVALREPR